MSISLFCSILPLPPIYLYEKILICSTLVVLNLNGNGVLTIDYVHNSLTNLPNLKKLHFTRVHFLKLQFLIKILSVCPLLEDLLIKNVTADYHNAAAADMLKPFPNLLKAHISDSSSSISSCFPLNLFYNVEFLRTQVTLQTSRHYSISQFNSYGAYHCGRRIFFFFFLGLVKQIRLRLPLSSHSFNSL